MGSSTGVLDRRISDTPIAVVDIETTGLTAGADRIIEISVARVDPGEEPKIVLDTLVNPMRRMAATEIHGITDQDVANAPRFSEIAGELLGVLHDCVVAAYNVYFDMKFLDVEFRGAGVDCEPPHFCLMYMRPMLGLGSRCKLEEACRCHGIEYLATHVAAADVIASARLFVAYREVAKNRGILTFGDLGGLKKYKFIDSFGQTPLPHPSVFGLPSCRRLRSRTGHIQTHATDPACCALASYWDTLKTVIADLEITDEELAYVEAEKERLGLATEQIRSIHARAFASVIAQFTEDKRLDDREARKLQRLYHCLSRLGWAPGE